MSADGELFRTLYPALRRYAAVIGSLGDDPDDLVQEALARTLTRHELVKIDNPSAYLRRVISNLVVDGVRADAVRTRHATRTQGDAAAHDTYPSDLDELRRLSAVERAVVYLIDVEGVSFAEAANALGISPVAARLRASRGRRTLRQLLEEQQ